MTGITISINEILKIYLWKTVVECINLTHYYGKKMVYEDLNFKIKRGSILGLLGKNGAGKTTTINIINGFLTPKSGKMYNSRRRF